MQAAIALLKAALALLIAVQANPGLPASFQASAVSLANTAIITAEQTIEAPTSPTATAPSAPALVSITLAGSSSQDAGTGTDASAPTPELAPVSISSVPQIDHITIGDTGGYYKQAIGAPHCIAPASVPSADQATDDCQVVQLAVYVYNSDGTLNKTATVSVNGTDAAQDKTIDGTGIAQGFYQFNYLFRDAQSTVTFTVGDASSSITLQAQ